MDERTAQVDSTRLKQKVSEDRRASDGRHEHETAKMEAVRSITRDGIEHDGNTVPMPAVDGQQTQNFSVPDELLASIAPRDDDASTMELGLDDVLDVVRESESANTVERDFVLERLPDDTLEGEFTHQGTKRWRRELKFEAEIDDQGRLYIPRDKLKDSGVRPGMRFKVVATQILPDD